MGLLSSLFGGSSSKNSSSNQAYGYLKDTLGGNVTSGNSALSSIANFLGLNGADGTASANAGLQNYMNSTGYQSALKSSTDAITGSAAARGLFQSGATGKAINSNASNLAQQSAGNYLSNLGNLAQLGLSSAGLIGSAGAVSTGKGSSSTGIINSLFSDRRLKRNIRLIGSANGIPIYSYKYKWGFSRHIGVMAQDVARLRPDALGPRRFGFMTVNYARLFGEG